MKLKLNNYTIEIVKPSHRLLVAPGVPRTVKSLYLLARADVQALGYYAWSDLPEELCRKMCKRKDNGSQFSACSRYEYTTPVSIGHKSGDYLFPFGTARAAVQKSIIDKLEFKKGDFIKVTNLGA